MPPPAPGGQLYRPSLVLANNRPATKRPMPAQGPSGLMHLRGRWGYGESGMARYSFQTR